MIAATETRRSHDETPPPQASANPLRRGDFVTCPACLAEGEMWRWALRRTPRYEEATVPVYRCGQCRNVFAVKE